MKATIVTAILIFLLNLSCLGQQYNYSAISFIIDNVTEVNEYVTCNRYNTFSETEPYQWLGFTIYKIRKSGSSSSLELDSLYQSVSENMAITKANREVECPKQYEGYTCSCIAGYGTQGDDTYYFQLYTIQKDGYSLWIEITRSDDPYFKDDYVNRFFTSLTINSKDFVVRQ